MTFLSTIRITCNPPLRAIRVKTFKLTFDEWSFKLGCFQRQNFLYSIKTTKLAQFSIACLKQGKKDCSQS